ncbi:hypothetical protein HZA44_01530 [Candidatus Peregrinibacteria bacterium]|nr:hypothetical protein [Candidatus Peregrinibacteria bacterium]
MPNPNAPKVFINPLDEKLNNPDELEIPEAKQSIVELLRRRAGKGLSHREEAEDAFALSVSEENEIPNPEELLMAKETSKRNEDVQLN